MGRLCQTPPAIGVSHKRPTIFEEIRRYVALTTCNRPHYPRLVELFARTDRSSSRRAVAKAGGSPALRLAEVAKLVQPQLEQVETRIAQQASAFDPAIEGYVVYAVGSRGKRLDRKSVV